MKLTYEVGHPPALDGQGVYTKQFKSFYESSHDSVLIECDTIEEAMKLQKHASAYMNRRRIYDVRITRRKEKVWMNKNAG